MSTQLTSLSGADKAENERNIRTDRTVSQHELTLILTIKINEVLIEKHVISYFLNFLLFLQTCKITTLVYHHN